PTSPRIPYTTLFRSRNPDGPREDEPRVDEVRGRPLSDVDGRGRARRDPSAKDGGAAAGTGASRGRAAVPRSAAGPTATDPPSDLDRKSTRLNSSHVS